MVPRADAPDDVSGKARAASVIKGRRVATSWAMRSGGCILQWLESAVGLSAVKEEHQAVT